MKSLIATVCILGLVGMVVGTAVQGANTAPVSATVTAKVIAVTATWTGAPTPHDYGILDQGAVSTPFTVTVTNAGNVTEKFQIKGVNTANWTIGDTAGTNVYEHMFSTDSWVSTEKLGLAYDYLNSVDPATGISVNSGNTQAFALKLKTPTFTEALAQQSVSVTVLATE